MAGMATTSNETILITETEEWADAVIITLSTLGALTLFLIVVVIVAIVYSRMSIKKYGRFKPLYDTYKDVENTMDLSRLIKVAGDTIASDAVADEFVAKIQTEKANDRADDMIVLKNVRMSGLKLKKSTQLVLKGVARGGDRLHMTRLHDYFGNLILLSQAPLPRQFADHWKAIWQEKVGLVVWVGPLVEVNETKLDAYISLRERTRIRCGDFLLETTVVIRRPNDYDSYLVHATKTSRVHATTRRITFMHIHAWPDTGVPLAPAKLADFVERMQETQHSKDADQHLPGLLLHCSVGVQRSPTLLAVYVARQMWMLERKVNLLGIFRYIRRCRYKALDLGNVTAQVQIAFGIVQVFATRKEMGKVGMLTVEQHERDIFDQRHRQEEVDVTDVTMVSYSAPRSTELSHAGPPRIRQRESRQSRQCPSPKNVSTIQPPKSSAISSPVSTFGLQASLASALPVNSQAATSVRSIPEEKSSKEKSIIYK